MIEERRFGSYTEYSKDKKPHRTNGPARVYDDGDTYWWLFGIRHRYYGPQSSNEERSIWRVHDKEMKYEVHSTEE